MESKAEKSASTVDHLPIKVDFDSEVGRERGLREVFSAWPKTKDAEIKKISVISGGITNVLYRVDLAEKSYLFRIYGRNTEILIDRHRETKYAIEIGQQGFCPMILCVFENGRVEQFIEAKTLEPSEMGFPEFQSGIAIEFSKMHRDLVLSTLDKKPQLKNFLVKFKDIVERIEFKNNPKKHAEFSKFDFKAIFADMEKTISFVEECYSTLRSDNSFRNKNETEYWARQLLLKPAVAHNDLLSGNILSTTATKKIVFIDFEYACYNYIGFDIANHFNEYAGFDCNFRKSYPTRRKQTDFLIAYWSVPGSLPEDFPKKLFDSNFFWKRIFWWIDYFAYLDHYLWGLWGVCQSSISTVDFDYLKYAKDRLVDGISFHKEVLSSSFHKAALSSRESSNVDELKLE